MTYLTCFHDILDKTELAVEGERLSLMVWRSLESPRTLHTLVLSGL